MLEDDLGVTVPDAARDQSLIAFTGRGNGYPEAVCMAIIDDEELYELACVDHLHMDRGALTLEFIRGDTTWTASWSRDGDVSVRGITAD